jgi:dUTP pyrophosphatase
MEIKVKKLKPDAVIPNYALEGDVGLDMYSLENCEIQPGQRHIFKLGFAMEFPTGFGAFVMDKGGMSLKGLHTMGGVYDAGYRGEYNAHLINLNDKPYKVSKGDKVAQLVILPVSIAKLIEVDELSNSQRGLGRFGSTGK